LIKHHVRINSSDITAALAQTFNKIQTANDEKYYTYEVDKSNQGI
jgi:hypothetical protein